MLKKELNKKCNTPGCTRWRKPIAANTEIPRTGARGAQDQGRIGRCTVEKRRNAGAGGRDQTLDLSRAGRGVGPHPRGDFDQPEGAGRQHPMRAGLGERRQKSKHKDSGHKAEPARQAQDQTVGRE